VLLALILFLTRNVYEGFNKRVCCIYAYYEKNELYKRNFEYFLQNGVYDNVDYVIVINGECTVDIPVKENIRILRRENKGYDFGAYSHAIHNIYRKYDYYFFINTSVEGPYGVDNWVDHFLKLFRGDVKIVGTSINILSTYKIFGYDLCRMYGHSKVFPHVQSMFFGLDRDYLEFLVENGFFNEDELYDKDIEYVIVHKEIGLSQIALLNGWNINCILPKYKDLDYRTIEADINPTSTTGDPYYKGGYFGGNIQKDDVIFYKGYRLN
jgi:hypothetical protein